jgi:hypothetical protein
VVYCIVSVEGDSVESNKSATLYYFDQVPRIGELVLLPVGSDRAPISFIVRVVKHVPERLPDQPETILVVKETKAYAEGS